jgi:hypothetical protein
MKILKTSALAALLAVSYLQSPAQTPTVPINEPNYNKPKLFSDLPDNLSLRLTDMEALLDLLVGTPVASSIATGFPLTGVVVSKSNPSDAFVKTVVIKSSNRPGAIFTFSRVTSIDGSFSYTGRMMSKDAGDALEIIKEANGYVIRKKGLYDLISE